jgi:hypothetical protein
MPTVWAPGPDWRRSRLEKIYFSKLNYHSDLFILVLKISSVCVQARLCAWVWMPKCAGVCMRVRAFSLACPSCNAYSPCYDVIYDPSIFTIFFDIISLKAWFSEKKKSLNIKCVFRFSLRLIFEKFLILRRNQRDIVINVKTCSCKVPVILVGF